MKHFWNHDRNATDEEIDELLDQVSMDELGDGKTPEHLIDGSVVGTEFDSGVHYLIVVLHERTLDEIAKRVVQEIRRAEDIP